MAKDWIKKVSRGIERRGTKGVFTKAKIEHGYPATKSGTLSFANAVLGDRIKGMKSKLWHDRAGLAKAFVHIADKRKHHRRASTGGIAGKRHALISW